MLYRAEKEKQQLKIEVEQAKEQVENVGKAKVRSNIIIIIIIKHVLIKVTLSCQRHCRGTAQSLTSKKKKNRQKR